MWFIDGWFEELGVLRASSGAVSSTESGSKKNEGAWSKTLKSSDLNSISIPLKHQVLLGLLHQASR